MRDKELYGRILGVEAPWRVADVELNLQQGEIVVHVEHGGPLTCPHCGQAARRYDSRQRRWRHLDTCQYRTVLAADVPRSQCRQHGVKQIEVPWSEGRSRLTALCEAVVIDWLQTARAWGYKEHAMTLWRYRSRGWARKAWQAWYRSAIRCRLEPVKRVARMVKRHLEGIVTAVVQGVSNARAESINAGVQWLKYAARGFRNRQRFRNAIYFHLGGLDLYPPVSSVITSATRKPEDRVKTSLMSRPRLYIRADQVDARPGACLLVAGAAPLPRTKPMSQLHDS